MVILITIYNLSILFFDVIIMCLMNPAIGTSIKTFIFKSNLLNLLFSHLHAISSEWTSVFHVKVIFSLILSVIFLKSTLLFIFTRSKK
jgi:hypothetical protein